MPSLSSAELLNAWERGLSCSPLERGLGLLALASQEADPSTLAEMPIGARDAHILELRELIFGRELTSLATCPACGERLELEFSTSELRSGLPGLPEAERSETLDGWRVRYRLPSSLDLMAALKASTHEQARRVVLERCLLEWEAVSEEAPGEAAPSPALLDALGRRLDAIDDLASLQLALVCPACGHHWEAAFDVLSFFWTELHAWAQRTLVEIHVLARAYGWGEAEILALSPRRRQIYLELARG